MKSLTAIALLTTLCVGFTAHVDAKNRENRPPRPDFSTIDVDGNGIIELSEFSAQELPPGVDDIEEVFNQIDTDQNGEISEEEFTSHKPPHRQR
ncbi:EF-hand domain-containing protein [Pseudoalteromonas sp. KAN5]|uniref:EF-hand domain-containing protein n=1 Tax=Pseudoalteromonas sp. KAN5 TaxID=2916633 RepID=UPI001FCBAB6C|nr:EF-hand domain-containing protein [Pseudoalteromonas sp. KAN5]BDF95104.1 hypothetical protein KAN5_19420 [Pseudoalteromonas sp. KAN5]